MILLDTNAIIWSVIRSDRVAPLRQAGRLYISPVSLLELQFLLETGKLALARGQPLDTIADDALWSVDSPDMSGVFRAARDVDWTRDPFDRLIVGHALSRRYRVATGDRTMVAKLGRQALPL